MSVSEHPDTIHRRTLRRLSCSTLRLFDVLSEKRVSYVALYSKDLEHDPVA